MRDTLVQPVGRGSIPGSPWRPLYLKSLPPTPSLGRYPLIDSAHPTRYRPPPLEWGLNNLSPVAASGSDCS